MKTEIEDSDECPAPLNLVLSSEQTNTTSRRRKVGRPRKLIRPTIPVKIESFERSADGLLPCSVCGKSFVSLKNFLSHQKTHTNQRPYQCLDCGRKFSLRNTLVCHTRVHTKEKPYTCTMCLRSFTQPSTLKAHIIYKHTRKFPYLCDVCGHGFISPGHKVEHMARVHGLGLAYAGFQVKRESTAETV
ncbi:zinc finger protein 22-like isoform X2 [Centruroides sculpturatus]|nr:zinc finger protein 22-like isoform X2 [Centruroides sculpturatus]XP_023236227.1 zinc finger protein 22-like isoform X2 [Centruroides sculpturatus]